MKHKTEREQVITERDALKLDLQSNTLSNTERLETAHKIDQLNERINQGNGNEETNN